MTMQAVCEGWWEDLNGHVDGLSDAVQHLYAPWSPELFKALVGEIHLAVFPQGDVDVTRGLTVGDPSTDEITTRFEIDVWQGGTAADGRLVEDPTADRAWLQLYESVRGRLYITGNQTIGGLAGPYLRYVGGQMGSVGAIRFLTQVFQVRWSLSHT